VKEQHIAQLEKEREDFGKERYGYVQELMNYSRKVGELETKLLQLGAPAPKPAENV